ncbi:PrpF domain-containing protein [Nocardioides humi]|uniref:2-methylaconitate cis-trans isomerase PrpF n=1 Tax=Nocardioides humi TaxID=449461 RepID=A0ABN2ACC1_9ACTN|nr:PrpF domain-containing protein [Nocardioides humi]
MSVRPRALDVVIARGGSSRGVMLRLDDLPPPGPARDELTLRLVGSPPTEGLGGGSPVTNKVVAVGVGPSGADLEYVVGNVSSDATTVDWSGTCGNMTSAVVPFGYAAGLLTGEPSGAWRLRNLATNGLIEVGVLDVAALETPGAEVRLTTEFLDPGGAVLGRMLPTGRVRDVIEVDDLACEATLVDVTHPYLLLRHGEVVGERRLSDPATLARIERVRGTVCVRLGLCADPMSACTLSPAVPRVVLVHPREAPTPSELRILAVSLGEPVHTVPVTAGLALAAASRIHGTLVHDPLLDVCGAAEVGVVGPTGRLTARSEVAADGTLVSVGLGRTARLLAQGRAWV